MPVAAGLVIEDVRYWQAWGFFQGTKCDMYKSRISTQDILLLIEVFSLFFTS